MKNRDILDSFYNLSSLSYDIQFPGKVSYAIVRNFHVLQPIVQDIEAAREIIIRDLGEPILGEPGKYKEKELPESEKGKLFKEINSLLDTETNVELQYIRPQDIQDLPLSISEMNYLFFMIREEE